MNFIPNPLAESIAKELAADDIADIAEQGLEIARRLVPVDTGALRDSLHLEDADEEGGKRIVTDSDHWIFPEFGTSEMPPQPYLRPIIDTLGLHR